MFQTLVLPQQRAKAQGEPEAGGIFALSAIVEKVLRSCGQEGTIWFRRSGIYNISIFIDQGSFFWSWKRSGDLWLGCYQSFEIGSGARFEGRYQGPIKGFDFGCNSHWKR